MRLLTIILFIILPCILSAGESIYYQPYDTHGKLTPWEWKVSEREYDDQGRLTFERSWKASYPGFGLHCGRSRTIYYNTDNTVEQIYDCYYPDRSPEFKGVTVEVKDKDGSIRRCKVSWGGAEQRVEMSVISGNSERIIGGETITRYTNARGQITTERHEVDGVLAYKYIMTYDGRGNMATRLRVDTEGNGVVRQEWFYTYDANGEWVKRREQRVYFDEVGRSIVVPVGIERRER